MFVCVSRAFCALMHTGIVAVTTTANILWYRGCVDANMELRKESDKLVSVSETIWKLELNDLPLPPVMIKPVPSLSTNCNLVR